MGLPERTERCGNRGAGRNRLSGCEYPCAMGLLQRFARPEYRPGAPESPPEPERREETPSPGGTDHGGGSVYESESYSQEGAIGNDAPAPAPGPRELPQEAPREEPAQVP